MKTRIVSGLRALLAICGPALADENALPPPTGPFAVGSIGFDWTDARRSDPLAKDGTSKRRLSILIWYPASPESGRPATYLPEPEYWVPVHGERARHINEAARPYAKVDAEPSKRPDRFPVVIFSPGANQTRRFYQSLFEEWASHGFAVVAIAHPHANRDIFLDGTRLSAHNAWSPPSQLRELEQDKELYDFWNPMIDCLSADQRFVLDQLERVQDGSALSPLARRLDLKQIVLAGHSRGAKAAYRTARTDPRVRGCLVLDDPPPPPERSGLPVPLMVLMPKEATPPMDAFTSEIFENSRRAVFWASLKDATHMSFSDLPLLAPDGWNLTSSQALGMNQRIRELTTGFLRFCLDGTIGQALRAEEAALVTLRTKNIEP